MKSLALLSFSTFFLLIACEKETPKYHASSTENHTLEGAFDSQPFEIDNYSVYYSEPEHSFSFHCSTDYGLLSFYLKDTLRAGKIYPVSTYSEGNAFSVTHTDTVHTHFALPGGKLVVFEHDTFENTMKAYFNYVLDRDGTPVPVYGVFDLWYY